MANVARTAVALAAALALGTAPVAGTLRDDAVPPPNVIVIVTDTVRADHSSAFGYARPTTPRIAELLPDSVAYANAWSPAEWTAPAHASLFTGLRPTHHRLFKGARDRLGAEHTTLAELLAARGYACACVSANPVVSEAFGLMQGFAAAPRVHVRAGTPLPRFDDIRERAVAFARDARDRETPFLLVMNAIEAHLPYDAQPDIAARFLQPGIEPDLLAAARAWDNPVTMQHQLGLVPTDPDVLALLPDLYDAEIAAMDAGVGRLLDRLRDEGLLDGALVIVTSDHGESLGEHGMWDHRFSLHAQLRRVPLLVRYPDGVDAGRVVTDVVRLEDVFATILDVCGFRAPTRVDGESLRSNLPGRIARATRGAETELLGNVRRAHPGLTRRELSIEQQAVFDGRFHLIRDSDGAVALYDHNTDPSEDHNVSAEKPDDVRRLSALLDR